MLVFAIGVATGSVITAFIMNRFHRSYLAEIHSMDVGATALRAEFLKAGEADIVLQSAERSLVEGILSIHENEELRNARTADISLKAAKRFYFCSKTEYPSEIAEIMNNLPPVEESACTAPN